MNCSSSKQDCDPTDPTIIPESPVKPAVTETPRLLPEFRILLRVHEDTENREETNNKVQVARNLNTLFNHKGLPSKLDNSAKKMPQACRKSSSKRPKSNVGHAIKRPKQSVSNPVTISDNVRAILERKKAFAISTNNDKDVAQIQTQVDSLLDVLAEPLPENNHNLSMEKNNQLITSVDKADIGMKETPKKVLTESEMDLLVNKILSCEQTLEPHPSVDLPNQMLKEFEEVVNRVDSTPETDLFAEEVEEDRKLYPVFIKGATSKNLESLSKPSNKPTLILPYKDTGDKEQMILDAGQKKYGQEQCPTCNCVYDPDDRKDVEVHLKYHNKDKVILKYKGWKNERVITQCPNDGKVIQVVKSDPPKWWGRIKEILQTVDFELGIVSSEDLEEHKNCTVYLYVRDKQIVGFLLAEDISHAHKLLDTSEILYSEESYPVLCGVSRLWTAAHVKSTDVARTLVDSMRETFEPLKSLAMDEFAFATPTSAPEREFPTEYAGTKCYLVY